MLTPHDLYNSKEFEQLVARIHSILEKTKSRVTWNDKIIDPDSPNRTRQIDITIREGDFLTIVECRVHKQKQDVKWIEELIGRRLSLNADAVIAVSASGFTQGAINKAKKHGIIIRDYLTLTEQEIQRWGCISKVHLTYIEFIDPHLIFKIMPHVQKLNVKQSEVMELFYNIAHKTAIEAEPKLGNDIQSVEIGMRLEKKRPDSLDVEYVTLKSGVRRITQDLDMVSVLSYGLQNEQQLAREVFVEKFSEVSSIEHVQNNNVMVMDFSQVKQPPNTIYLFTQVQMSGMNESSGIHLVQIGEFKPNLILNFKSQFVK